MFQASIPSFMHGLAAWSTRSAWTRSTGADDEAILNDTLKSRILLPALVLVLQLEASKWQALSVKANAKANAMTTKIKAHIAKCSHVQCSVLAVNWIRFFS